ncbi:SAXO1 [Branchiostoma lanceolatum]|uniref:SAXO1 protein n=1 Tax=Branchiostoma lanceolatum TaxID=7740 RepID=A0A8S4MQG7_BRALA|nr:SAXO1 [Branchiostoma lanceolatum]
MVSSTKDGTVCICQICDCGRHHCPHQKQPDHFQRMQADQKRPPAGATGTEYREEFKAWPTTGKLKSLRPEVKSVATKDPMQLSTIYRDLYIAHLKPEKVTSLKPTRVYTPPEEKLETSTTYSKCFAWKYAEPPNSLKPKPQLNVPNGDNQTPFSKDTVTKLTYKEFSREEQQAAKCEIIKHKEELGTDEGAKLEVTTSSYTEDFPAHGNVAPPESTKPTQEYIKPDKPFEDDTVNKLDYVPHPPQPRPVKKKIEYTPNNKPFEGVSMMKAEFPVHSAGPHRPRSFKPPQEYKSSQAKFRDGTTQSMAFKPWPLPKKEKWPWASRGMYTSPADVFRCTTSYREDFVQPAKVGDRPKPFRPVSKRADTSDKKVPFQGQSTTRSTYVPWNNTQPVKSYKKSEIYSPPSEKFVAQSTYQTRFTGEMVSPARSCRPAYKDRYEDGRPAMEASTTYRECFTVPARPMSCPAMKLSLRAVANEAVRQGSKCTAVITAPENDVEYSHKASGHTYYRLSKRPNTSKQPASGSKDSNPK